MFNIKKIDFDSLKNKKYKLISYSLMTSLLMSGCSIQYNETTDLGPEIESSIINSNDNYKIEDSKTDSYYNVEKDYNDVSITEENNNDETTNEHEEEIDEFDELFIEPESIPTPEVKIDIDNNIIKAILDKDITISSTEANNLINAISKINVDYPNSEYFGIDEALAEYKKLNLNNKGTKFRVNSNELYNKVLENNKRYLEETGLNKFNNISSSELSKIVSIIADNINDKIDRNLVTNYDDLKEILDNLKIYDHQSFGYGGFDNKNFVLEIDINAINKKKSSSDVDILEMTCKHESNHIIQSIISKDNLEIGYGISYKFNNLKINPLYNSWLYEASAEKETLNDYNDDRKSLNYSGYISSLELLTLSTLLNSKVSPTTIEDINYQNDLIKLFNIFNTKNKEEEKEIIKMLYSFQIYHYIDTEYRDVYEEKTGYRYKYSELEDYSIQLRKYCAVTLTKSFYKNLYEGISNKKIKVEELFSIISIFEKNMINITGTNGTINDDKKIFINEYNNIQNELFELLSSKTRISTDELYNTYNEVFNKINNEYNNKNWLDENENNFLKKKIIDKNLTPINIVYTKEYVK